MLENRTFGDGFLRAEALFILGRALLRLQRSSEVVDLLGATLETFSEVDEICTARMLYGTAIARAQDADQGLALLTAVASFAEGQRAHRAIQAEIAYYRGLAHWTKREYSEASRYATIAERANLDILSVRAMELRAFVALAVARFGDALQLFNRARQAYGLCKAHDVDLATQIVFQIASLEMNLRSAKIPGTHVNPDSRTIPGIAFGPSIATATRMQLMIADAWLFAHDGDRMSAFRKVYSGIGIAPTPAWRVWALASAAAVFQAFEESGNARIHADNAALLAAHVDWNATAAEEWVGLLRLTEVLAVVNPPSAPELLKRFDAVSSKTDPTRVLRDHHSDPRLAGYNAYVRGLVARAIGENELAGNYFRTAAAYLQSCGYLWLAALALIELDATPIDTRGELALERAAVIVRDNFPDSFLARRLGSWAWAYVDPVGSKLTPAQRDVLRRLLEGKKAPVISAETNRAHTTVRKHIKDIHAAFGTHSFAELFAECLRRGIASPGVPNPGARIVAIR